MTVTVEQLRREAMDLLADDPDACALRSCWDCNGAHEHLKQADYVINCFGCGRWLYKGQDVTDYGDEAPVAEDVRCVGCGRPYTPGRECRIGGECSR